MDAMSPAAASMSLTAARCPIPVQCVALAQRGDRCGERPACGAGSGSAALFAFTLGVKLDAPSHAC